MLLKRRKKPKFLVAYLNPKLRISKMASLSPRSIQNVMMFKSWVFVNLTSLSDEYKECRRIIELASMELGIYLHQRSLFNPNSDGNVNPHVLKNLNQLLNNIRIRTLVAASWLSRY
ncbi:hypothetical protein I7I50_04614 [Histoplasma capsulatum G186AR]|uniref:Uncharacterized protein n=1 Tax=Ajellomyces capsulatus TaxID=5037 RepID=A0A8H8CY39_AJECA|nr:hypothetical protein I7I52_05523 [Histoplasma capsulatum]QSS75471.1 hypothetical protein I7I50_04614 [Histoplasma capsulatum G186AR]